jgi:hypothetical protein
VIVTFVRLVALVILLVGPVGSRAGAQGVNSPEAVQAGKELFAIMSPTFLEQTAAQMLASTWPPMEAAVRRGLPNIETEMLAELRAEFARSATDFLRDSMVGAPAVYAKYFTAEELRQLAAFYRTPVGARTLEFTPQIMGEVMSDIMPRAQQWQGRFAETMKAILRKHGHTIP